MNIIDKNIENLTSLWERAGHRHKTLVTHNTFNSVVIAGSQWPNRIWSHSISTPLDINRISAFMTSDSTPTTLSVFNHQEHEEYLASEGFEKVSEQIGMHLKLQNPFPKSKLTLGRVSEQIGSELWSQLFEMSFGYSIPSKVVMQLAKDADFHILISGINPVGTALLYSSNNEAMGIHALGIISEFRRQGLAEQAMYKLLNTAYQQKFELAILQASVAGEGLYRKLGFSTDFTIKNYRLTNHKTL